MDSDGCVDEVPYDGVDQDCDGLDLTDVDGDGWDAVQVGGEDCRDGNPEIHPDAQERCATSADEDCDGAVDEGCEALLDPADPGGFSWSCGPQLAPGLPLALLSLWVLRRASGR